LTQPDTALHNEKFDWAIYVDATLAGLAILIPIPLLDLLFEWLFKRRMAQAIAKRNGRSLSPNIIRQLNQSHFSCTGCLLWPLQLVWLLLKRTYRTILYFLTIKDASDKLSYYWHRAYLLDNMMRRGDLDDEEDAVLAAQALQQLLDSLTTSPLTQLAQQVVASVHHILRASWRWLRRKQEDEMMRQTRLQMANAWRDLAGYFAQVAAQYQALLDQLHVARLEENLSVEQAGENTAVSPFTPPKDRQTDK
jgi:hypothetical protein